MTADIGLQGMRARKDGEMVEAMDVGVGGGIGDEPAFIEWVRQRVPADEVPGLVKNLVEAFAALREEGQTFREWVDATGHESIHRTRDPRGDRLRGPLSPRRETVVVPVLERGEPRTDRAGRNPHHQR